MTSYFSKNTIFSGLFFFFVLFGFGKNFCLTFFEQKNDEKLGDAILKRFDDTEGLAADMRMRKAIALAEGVREMLEANY